MSVTDPVQVLSAPPAPPPAPPPPPPDYSTFALPPSPPRLSLAREITDLRGLLQELLMDIDLSTVNTIASYCKGADTLARLVRAEAAVTATHNDSAVLDAILDTLDEA